MRVKITGAQASGVRISGPALLESGPGAGLFTAPGAPMLLPVRWGFAQPPCGVVVILTVLTTVQELARRMCWIIFPYAEKPLLSLPSPSFSLGIACLVLSFWTALVVRPRFCLPAGFCVPQNLTRWWRSLNLC